MHSMLHTCVVCYINVILCYIIVSYVIYICIVGDRRAIPLTAARALSPAQVAISGPRSGPRQGLKARRGPDMALT